MTKTTLRLGTRGSELALWQARRVAAMVGERLGLECTLEIVKTKGDQVQDVAFHKMEGKGFFTKELQEALLDGRVDLVVHSLKDLPTEEPPGLGLLAIPERESSAELLLAGKGTLRNASENPLRLPAGAVLGTSSLRRAAQALALRPGLELKPLRGNVPTRVRKLREGQYDAILLAAAGVRRLGLDLGGLDQVELGPEILLPAPGQGALAIEGRTGDPHTARLAELHDAAVAACVTAERRLLQLLGGGCHLPLGCLASRQGDGIRLRAALGEVDEALSSASVVKVEAVAATPDAAASACLAALRPSGEAR